MKTNITQKLVLLVVGLLCCINMSAYDFEKDGIYYDILSSSDKTVRVTSHPQKKYTGDITIPESVTWEENTYAVTAIFLSAFEGSNLTSIVIPNSVIQIGDQAFEACDKLTSVSLGNGVTSIGFWAFKECSKLTSIEIPNSVIEIRDEAFKYAGLTSVTIPNSVTDIGEKAFKFCEDLISVTIGDGVTYIGDDAFANCPNLTSVTITATSAPSFGSVPSSTFKGSDNLKIYVPRESWEVYQSAWASYSSHILAAFDLPTISAEARNWSTYYDNTANTQVDENTTVYKVELSGTAITLTDTGSRIIKAGEAVVLSSTTSGIDMVYMPTESEGDYTGNALLGGNTAVEQESGYIYYALANLTSGLGFYKVANGLNIPAHKAYIRLYTATGAPSFISINETTGIDKPISAFSEGRGAYYDFSGHKIPTPKKGLYIVNGKKFIINNK